jgi:hypothetical protein
MATDTLGDYTDDTTDTYAQIVVPSYALENPVAPSPKVTTGSSFIRLGSFPSLTDSSEQPSGFTNSLALAQLVGGAAKTYPSTTATLASNLSESGDDPAPDSLLKASDYKGDANYLLGFADDTRYRGADPDDTFIDWVGVSSTVANRQAETNRLLFKGGWWDHADGNRVTTTCGDKIEVIQGNYKMVVLGRQDPSTTDLGELAANTLIADYSGGQIVAQDAGPTPNVQSIEYVQEGDCWTMYQDNVTNGNVTTRMRGQQASYFKGSSLSTEIGKNPGDSQSFHDVHEDEDPVIISKTWAKRMETYIGANDKPVPVLYTWTHALSINNIQTSPEITNTYFATTWEVTIGAKTTIVIGPSIEIIPVFKVDIGVAKYQFMNMTNVVTAEKNDAAAIETRITGVETRINATCDAIRGKHTTLAGTVSRMQGDVTYLNAMTVEINDELTQVHDSKVEMAGDITILAALMTI